MLTTLAALNISADISFRKLESTHPEYYELVFDILGDKERTKVFERADCYWKGFINQKFCFIVVSVEKDGSTVMELYHNKDAVFFLFSNCEDKETTIWQLTCVHDEYMPFTDFILSQFIKLSTENKNTAIMVELRNEAVQFEPYFQKHQFKDTVCADKDVLKSLRKELS